MTVEQRLSNLENLVNALSKKIDNNKYYTDADVNGNRKSVTDITPYTETKTAYIDDEYVTFDIAKDGNISVYMVDGDGQNVPCSFEQINGQIKVSFEKRNSLATVTISIQ